MTGGISAETARAWVDIDLGALAANARAFQHLVGAPLLPMVKANAYGLGLAPVARLLESLQPWGYGVGTIEEGEELRALRITRPILVFTPLLAAVSSRLARARLTPCIGDADALTAWIALTEQPFHLEIDTGMRRAGVPWNDAEAVARVGAMVTAAPGWEGIFTHFHSAEHDHEATRLQWARLQEVIAAVGKRPRFVHAANSGAGVADLGLGADFARPGIYLYGGRVGNHTPHPVAALRARVVAIRRVSRTDTVGYEATWQAERPTTIVTLAVGYADGVPRALSNKGRVELDGRLHPIAGRVTMDMTTVDVGDAVVRSGDTATVYGGLASLDDQAEAAGTISYELLTSIGSRVMRRYV